MKLLACLLAGAGALTLAAGSATAAEDGARRTMGRDLLATHVAVPGATTDAVVVDSNIRRDRTAPIDQSDVDVDVDVLGAELTAKGSFRMNALVQFVPALSEFKPSLPGGGRILTQIIPAIDPTTLDLDPEIADLVSAKGLSFQDSHVLVQEIPHVEDVP